MEILITDIEKQEAVSSPGLKRYPDIVQMLSPDPLGGLSPVGALVPASVTPARLTTLEASATFVGMQAYKDIVALKYSIAPSYTEYVSFALASDIGSGVVRSITNNPVPYGVNYQFTAGLASFFDGGGVSQEAIFTDIILGGATGYIVNNRKNNDPDYTIAGAGISFVAGGGAIQLGSVTLAFYYLSESKGWVPLRTGYVFGTVVNVTDQMVVTPGVVNAQPDLQILTEVRFPDGTFGYVGPSSFNNPAPAVTFKEFVPISTLNRNYGDGEYHTRTNLVYYQGCWLSIAVGGRTVKWYGDIGIDEQGEFTPRFNHSKKITALIPVENSLLIFGESEAKILSGSLVEGTITLQDYPIPIGADDLGRNYPTSGLMPSWVSGYPVTGLYAIVIWRGKIWQVGIGQAREVSQVVQKPGYKFTAIHYDPTRNTVFARRVDGVWFGYVVDRDWWYQLSLNGIDYTYGWGGMFFNKNGATIRYATLSEDATGGTDPICKLGFTKWSPHPDVRTNWQPLELSFELYYSDDYSPSTLELPKPELHYWTYGPDGSVGVPTTVFGVQKGNRWVFPIQPKTIQYMTWWIEIRPSTSTPAEIRQIRIVGPIKFQVRSMATSERQGQK